MRLSRRLLAQVVQSTVVACLLYGCEVRTCTAQDYKRMQVFVNEIIRWLTWAPETGGMRQMEGKLAMTDLRLQLGLLAVKECVMRRQCVYLGHVARYPADRLERLALGAWLGSSKGRALGLRDFYWQRVREVMRHSSLPEREWPDAWM
eukprot:5722413-Pyramimonas_sp.AAC.1